MSKSPRDAVIISFCRTPIGKIGGSLSAFRPDDLVAKCLEEATIRSRIPKSQFEEVFAGCSNQAGEDNRNIARMSLLLAGFPDSVAGVTVNRLCASGLEAVVQAARSIKVGENDLTIASGVESMSRAPWVLSKPEKGFSTLKPDIYDTSLGWRFPNPRLEERFPLESMGETAENLAERFMISREEQDKFADESHKKAIYAQAQGYFKNAILPVSLKAKSGESIIFKEDESPRADSSVEKLALLRPIFRKNGSVTAGSSSGLNDGAAALVISSREFASANGIQPLATIKGASSSGVDPQIMGIGPVPATQKLLGRLGLKIDDLEAIEVNEAFAAQVLAVSKELKINPNKLNVFGGAIALGHPLGASGTRILGTLLDVLTLKKAALGLATLCVGVGQGLSVVIERD